MEAIVAAKGKNEQPKVSSIKKLSEIVKSGEVISSPIYSRRFSNPPKVEEIDSVFLEEAVKVVPGFVWDETNNDAITRIIDWAVGDRSRGVDPNKGILLMGPAGTGKTSLLLALRSFCKRIGAQFFISRKSSDEADDGWRPLLWMPRHTIDVVEEYRELGHIPNVSAPVYALDDLGTEVDVRRWGESAVNVIRILIARRCEWNAPLLTLISTNLDAHALQERYDDRTISRLRGEFNIIPVLGRDRRTDE